LLTCIPITHRKISKCGMVKVPPPKGGACLPTSQIERVYSSMLLSFMMGAARQATWMSQVDQKITTLICPFASQAIEVVHFKGSNIEKTQGIDTSKVHWPQSTPGGTRKSITLHSTTPLAELNPPNTTIRVKHREDTRH
jgi:hypothetical protein